MSTRTGIGTPPPMEIPEECVYLNCHELPEWQLCGRVWAPGRKGSPAEFKTGIVTCDACRLRVGPIQEMVPEDSDAWRAVRAAFASLGHVPPDYSTLEAEMRPLL